MRTLTLTNSLFDNLFTNGDRALFSGDNTFWRRDTYVKSNEREDAYEYYIPLAGFKKEDIEASVLEGEVYVLAKNDDDTASYSFIVPEGGDESKLSGKYKEGLLTLTIKKSKPAKSTVIKIN